MKNNERYQKDFAYKTDVGRVRLVNEDQSVIIESKNGDVLMVVADGMGGHNRGDYASRLTLDFIVNEFKTTYRNFVSIHIAKLWLHSIVSKANKLIFNTAEKDKTAKGMGTTLVVALIHGKSVLVINAGDSRAYSYNNHQLTRLSEDQSYVEYLKRSGQLTEAEAKKRKDKNILMNALGIYPSFSFNSKIYKYQNEPLLLCSDGLFNNLEENQIANIISKDLSAKLTVDMLIDEANKNGGSDNIAVAYFKRSNHD